MSNRKSYNITDAECVMPESQYERCVEYFKAGDFKSAEECITSSNGFGRRQSEANVILGTIYTAQERFSDAEFIFRETLAENPKSAAAWLGLGEMRLLKRELFEAEDCFRAALEIEPENGQAWNGLGVIVHERGEHERARMHFRNGIEAGFDEARLNLAAILSDQNKLEEAAAVLQPLTEAHEYRSEASLHLGYILLKLGRFDRALEQFNRAAELKKGALKEHYTEGMLHFQNGGFEKALTCFKKALEVDPRHFPAKNAVSACHSRIYLREKWGLNIKEGTITFSDEGDELMGNIYDYCCGSAKTKPMVSVIVCARKLNWELERCIHRCLHLDYQNYEIIVLPDRPLDKKQRGLRVIPTGKAPDEVKRIIGAREARGEILAFLDSYSNPGRNWLSRRIDFMNGGNLSAVGGLVSRRKRNGASAEAGGLAGSPNKDDWFLWKHGLFHKQVISGDWWDFVVHSVDWERVAGAVLKGDSVRKMVKSVVSLHRKSMKNLLLSPLFFLHSIWPFSILSKHCAVCIEKNDTGYEVSFRNAGGRGTGDETVTNLNVDSGAREAVLIS